MGHAYFCLNKYQDAVKAYENGLELDPNNATLQNSLATAKSKLGSGSVERAVPESNNGGMPNFGGAGGMPDLSSLLGNPGLMRMAEQMMQSGALNNLMSNPNITRMAQQMMGGGNGETPNIEEMMNDPEMRRLAQEAMGGAKPNNEQ
ncbi:hypothetical protein BD408DRAFT_410225 [Parasitella parasitica]|nr:hypothetical protein BD408DRAFT_410225 [Parasitella parasitica]